MSLQPSPIPPIRGSSPIGVKTYGSVFGAISRVRPA